MTSPRPGLPALWLCLGMLGNQTVAATLGHLKGQNLNDSATVCMSVGLMATLTGLDDIRLEPATGSVSGNARTAYSGGDTFRLSSNGAVAVMVTSNGVRNGNSVIGTTWRFDNNPAAFRLVTGDGPHDAEHRIDGTAVLGAISSQKAGAYTGVVTLTVTPEIGGLMGCGASTAWFPTKESWSILAFEDLYPSAGDKDYNDMVVAMRIAEDYNARNQLEHISMDFIPIARGAGYDHALMLSLDGVIEKSRNITTVTDPVFFGDAQVTVTRHNTRTGFNLSQMFTPTQNITIFGSTLQAAGSSYINVDPTKPFVSSVLTAHVDIALASPELNPATRGLAVDDFLYRPYLKVLNTGYDIDLAVNNDADRMLTRDGYPFGLMVPTEWAWPAERGSIDKAYPYFAEYRNWLLGRTSVLSEQAEHWYDYPSGAGSVQLVIPEFQLQ